MAPVDPVVFFDGVCGLCNGVVDRLIETGPTQPNEFYFKFAPLQGATAEHVLTQADRENLDSIVVFDHGKTLRKSKAALYILQHHKLKNPQLPMLQIVRGVLLLVGALLPQSISDQIYDLIARNRYRLFGKSELCRIPTPSERELFLP